MTRIREENEHAQAVLIDDQGQEVSARIDIEPGDVVFPATDRSVTITAVRFWVPGFPPLDLQINQHILAGQAIRLPGVMK